jgi:hypothetical protein
MPRPKKPPFKWERSGKPASRKLFTELFEANRNSASVRARRAAAIKAAKRVEPVEPPHVEEAPLPQAAQGEPTAND